MTTKDEREAAVYQALLEHEKRYGKAPPAAEDHIQVTTAPPGPAADPDVARGRPGQGQQAASQPKPGGPHTGRLHPPDVVQGVGLMGKYHSCGIEGCGARASFEIFTGPKDGFLDYRCEEHGQKVNRFRRRRLWTPPALQDVEKTEDPQAQEGERKVWLVWALLDTTLVVLCGVYSNSALAYAARLDAMANMESAVRVWVEQAVVDHLYGSSLTGLKKTRHSTQ